MDPGFAFLLAALIAPPISMAPGLPTPVESGSLPQAGASAPPLPTLIPTAGSAPTVPLIAGQESATPQASPTVAQSPQPQVSPSFEAVPQTSPSAGGMAPPFTVSPVPLPAEAAGPQEALDTPLGEKPGEGAPSPVPTPIDPVVGQAGQEAPGDEPSYRQDGARSFPDLAGESNPDSVQKPFVDGQVAKSAALPQPEPQPRVSPAVEANLPAALDALRADRYEPDRLMQAISRSVNSTPDGDYTVTLHLHPEQLGEVRLQLHLSGRTVHTVMEVTTPEARQALQARGDQLRQGLEGAGFTLSGFEVATGQQQQSARHRRDLLEAELSRQGLRGIEPVAPPPANPATAVERIRNSRRSGGRIDTMA